MVWSRDPNRRRGVPLATRRRIMGQHAGVCHLCGHGGADQIDHVVNVKTWLREGRPGSYDADSNLAPVHQEACPVCYVSCHQTKTQREARQGRSTRTRLPAEAHPNAKRVSDVAPSTTRTR